MRDHFLGRSLRVEREFLLPQLLFVRGPRPVHPLRVRPAGRRRAAGDGDPRAEARRVVLCLSAAGWRGEGALLHLAPSRASGSLTPASIASRLAWVSVTGVLRVDVTGGGGAAAGGGEETHPASSNNRPWTARLRLMTIPPPRAQHRASQRRAQRGRCEQRA